MEGGEKKGGGRKEIFRERTTVCECERKGKKNSASFRLKGRETGGMYFQKEVGGAEKAERGEEKGVTKRDSKKKKIKPSGKKGTDPYSTREKEKKKRETLDKSQKGKKKREKRG